MAKQSHTARTAEHFRKNGYICERVEQYNSFIHKKRDLYGLFDLLAINCDATVGIQVTDSVHANEHRTKLAVTLKDALATWQACPARRCELWVWKKVGRKWTVKVEVPVIRGSEIEWVLSLPETEVPNEK